MVKTQDDRRSSFRIAANAFVRWKKPDSSSMEAEDYFRDLQIFSLQSELDALSVQIEQVNERIKDIAALKSVQLLHQQIKTLGKIRASEQAIDAKLKTQPINISEGGCSFTTSDPINVDEQLALALVFSPNYFSLFTIARVCECKAADKTFTVHLEFSELKEKQRQELVRFLFQAQTLAKKAGTES